jgi:hypothetical protein
MSAAALVGWLETVIVGELLIVMLLVIIVAVLIGENRALRQGREPAFVPALLRRLGR